MHPLWLILLLVLPCVASCVGPGQPRAPEGAAARPNVIVILADDLGYGDLGSYNPDSKIPTPHLDRLAAEGMRFTDAHSPSAVCTPTRYGLLTGRYAWRTALKEGVLWGYSPSLIDTTRMTVASLLDAHGYATAAVGKWHLGLGTREPVDYSGPLRPGPNQYGFDHFFGIPASLDMDPYLYVENDRAVDLPTDSVGASARRWAGGGGFWRAGRMAPGFRHADVMPDLTREAAAFVSARKGAAEPFFLYFALTAPHTPWLPDAAATGRSGAGPYGDFVVQVDAAVGTVLAALEQAGLRDNTLVLFTSDNGANWRPEDVAQYGHRANGALRGQKADIWEGGHRVPFLVRWPGRVAPGTVSEATVSLTDLLATTADVLGARLPEDAGEDSYSILPALRGRAGAAAVRDAIVHHSLDGMFAVRQGPWKLIEGRGSGGFTAPRRIEAGPGEAPGQLYHLGDDPAEARDLYAARPDVVARLSALLAQYREGGRSRPAGPRPAAGVAPSP